MRAEVLAVDKVTVEVLAFIVPEPVNIAPDVLVKANVPVLILRVVPDWVVTDPAVTLNPEALNVALDARLRLAIPVVINIASLNENVPILKITVFVIALPADVMV